MTPKFFHIGSFGRAILALILSTGFATAEPSHGIAMYGSPALPPDFVSLPYVNPDAPKGGKIVLGEAGSFDSLNPFVNKGRAPYGLRVYGFESLMGRSFDEPFTLYGLLAESVETGPNREWVEFTLRPEARFSDGSPVTVEDVIWSFETLGSVGHGRYRNAWSKVQSIAATGSRSLRITFNTADREMALIMGLRPILKKAQWDGVDFAESGADIVPIGSAPYVVGDYELGRFINLERNRDYWGKDLPLRRGSMNFDTLRYDYYGDGDVVFEAFRGGDVDTFRETNAAKWAKAYDFPAVREGSVIKAEIANQRPSGIIGFVMNTRRPVFADWRVRQAMIEAFNYEFINQILNDGAAPRIGSYFSNSVLGMTHDPAQGRVQELLAPFADTLLPGTLEGYTLPVSDGREANRRNFRKSLKLLQEAGYSVDDDGVLKDAAGQPFGFEILLKQGATQAQQIIDIYVEALKQLGMQVSVNTVDSAQYKERTQPFDFDMTYYWRGVSLSPGNEQNLYWGSNSADQPGSRNWMGAQDPVIDAMIAAMLNAEGADEFSAAVKALDRVLMAGRYVIPIWYADVSRLAYASKLRYPETIPMYGDWDGFLPDIWWASEE